MPPHTFRNHNSLLHDDEINLALSGIHSFPLCCVSKWMVACQDNVCNILLSEAKAHKNSTNSAFSSTIKAVLCISGARGIFLVDYFLMFSFKRSPPRHALSIFEHAYYISCFIKKPSLVALNLFNSCCVIFRFHSLSVQQRDEITLEEQKCIS